MLAFDAAWWWHADRRLRSVPRAGVWRKVVAAFAVMQMALLLWWVIFGRLFSGGANPLLPTPLVSITFIWHLIILPTTVLLVALWLLGRGVRRLRGAIRKRETASTEETEPRPVTEPLPTRRALLRAAVVAAPPLITGVATLRGMSQLDEFRIRSIPLAIPGLPPELEGLTIAQVADCHVGEFTNGRTLLRIAEATNNLRPDLILMTGDLINRQLSDLPAALDMVRRMDARLGVFMCEGNHDLFEGRGAFASGVRRGGVPLLIDESVVIRVGSQEMQVLGLRWGHGPARGGGGDEALALSLPPLLQTVRPQAFPILMAHHPHAFDRAAAAGIPLTLSGHTHGGQLNLSHDIGMGRMYRYWSGPYAKGRSRLVVSNGVGNWFPLRINAPAEIVHITLHAENAS